MGEIYPAGSGDKEAVGIPAVGVDIGKCIAGNRGVFPVQDPDRHLVLVKGAVFDGHVGVVGISCVAVRADGGLQLVEPAVRDGDVLVGRAVFFAP